MKAAEKQEPVLSQDELSALLERLADKGAVSSWSGIARKDPASEARTVSLALQRASEVFAERASRTLSNVFQTTLRFSLIDWRESEPEEFEQIMVATDRAVIFEAVPGTGNGIMLLGRTLFYRLMCLYLGASPGLKKSAVPLRPYTTIECRFYRSYVEDLLMRLGEAWSDATRIAPKIVGLIERKHVREEAAESLYLATFDVAGFGEVCRLRVAVPQAAFEDRVAAAREVASLNGARVEESLLDMLVDISVEAGEVEMSLRDFSKMRAGDVIALEGFEDGELLINVSGVPKFHAIRGAVGRRLAVQLTDRI